MPITVGKPIEIDGILFDIVKVLGKGGLSMVFLGKNQNTSELVAIKEFFYQKFYDPISRKNDCAEFFENEILNTMAQSKSSPYAEQLLHYEKKEDLQTPEYYIIFSYIDGMTFLDFYRDFVQSCRGLEHLDLSSILRYIFIPLAEHLDYCHSNEHIVHRDFSVQNIIILKNELEEIYPVLIDWGVSKYLGPDLIYYLDNPYCNDETLKDFPISQKGAPPEVKFGYMPTAASDIYYLAHLMYFVFTGGIMREDTEILTPEHFVLNPKKINWYIPDEYNNLVIKLSQYEPANRPKNMKEVIKMLKELVQIKHIHYDFDFFMQPDTDELTGERMIKNEE